MRPILYVAIAFPLFAPPDARETIIAVGRTVAAVSMAAYQARPFGPGLDSPYSITTCEGVPLELQDELAAATQALLDAEAIAELQLPLPIGPLDYTPGFAGETARAA